MSPTPSHLAHSIILCCLPAPHEDWTSLSLQGPSFLIFQEKHDSKRHDLISSRGPQLLSSPPLFTICRVLIWKPAVTNIKFSSFLRSLMSKLLVTITGDSH